MDRRTLLRSGALLTGAGALTGIGREAQANAGALSQLTNSRPARPHVGRVVNNGVRLHVRDWGRGRPVVFLSGWGLPSDFWHYQMLDLAADGIRCVAYDRRGHGRADEPGQGYDYDTLADDLAAVLDELDLEAVTLVAYSLAGGEATRYLSRHGRARVARVVFLSATLPCIRRSTDNPDGAPAEALQQVVAAISADFPAWLATAEGPFWLDFASPEMWAWGRSLMYTTSVPVLIACYRAMIAADFRAELAALNLPALVIHGDRDTSAPLPLTGLRTAELVSGAQTSIYEGAPHGLPLTHRRRFNADLLTFMGT